MQILSKLSTLNWVQLIALPSNSETEDGFKNQFEWNASIETDIIDFQLYKSPQSQTDIITYNEDIDLNISFSPYRQI